MSFHKSRGRALGPWSTSDSIPNKVKFSWRRFSDPIQSSNVILNNVRSRSGVIQSKPFVTPTPATCKNLADGESFVPCSLHMSLGSSHYQIENYLFDLGTWNTYGSIVLASGKVIPSLDTITPLNKARQALFHKSNSIAKLLVTLGEFPETVQFGGAFIDRLRGVHNSEMIKINKSISVRRLSKKTPFTIARSIADYNLAYAFAVRPVIADARSVGEAIAASVTNFRPSHLRAAYTSESNYDEVLVLSPAGNLVPECTFNVLRKITRSSTVILGGTYVPDLFEHGSDLSYAQTFGLDISQVIPAVYELIPYSWLLDYFTNIGNILNAVSQNGIHLANPWQITIDQFQEVDYYTPIPLSGFTLVSQSSGYRKGKNFIFNRTTPNLSGWVPPFQLKRPGLSEIANIASLAAQKLIKPVDFVFGSKKSEVVSILSSLKFRNKYVL